MVAKNERILKEKGEWEAQMKEEREQQEEPDYAENEEPTPSFVLHQEPSYKTNLISYIVCVDTLGNIKQDLVSKYIQDKIEN